MYIAATQPPTFNEKERIMELGTKKRLSRIFNPDTKRAIVVPMDHGMTIGAPDGLVDIRKAVDDMNEGGANAVLMHKGLIRCSHRSAGKDVGLIVHLSASTMLTPNANTKTLVGTVEEGIKHGADAVSVHVNLGDPNERLMLADLGKVAAACDDWHMPLLAMMYARGPEIANSFDPKVVAHCARVGVELGADIVKVSYTGDMDSFADVVSGCCVPVVIAGGAGVSMGRNVFQHPRRIELMRALRAIVHDNADVDHALAIVGE